MAVTNADIAKRKLLLDSKSETWVNECNLPPSPLKGGKKNKYCVLPVLPPKHYSKHAGGYSEQLQ